jgi:serine/threonine protein kinase
MFSLLRCFCSRRFAAVVVFAGFTAAMYYLSHKDVLDRGHALCGEIKDFRINCTKDPNHPPVCTAMSHEGLPGFTLSLVNSLYGLVLFLTFSHITRTVYLNNLEATRGMFSSDLIRFSFHMKIVHATLFWAAGWGMYCVFSPGHNAGHEPKDPSAAFSIAVSVEHAIVTGGVRAYSTGLEVFTLVQLVTDSLDTMEELAMKWAAGAFLIVLAGNIGVLMAHCDRHSCDLDDKDIVTKLLSTVTGIEADFLLGKAVLFCAIYSYLLLYSISNHLPVKRKGLTLYSGFLLTVSLLRAISYGLLRPHSHFDGTSADGGVCAFTLSMLLYCFGFGYITYLALLFESRYWFDQLSTTTATPEENSLLARSAGRTESSNASCNSMNLAVVDTVSGASELTLTQGLLGQQRYNIDISDCIIPTIQLQRHVGPWNAPEGANAKVELFMYQQQLVAVKMLLPQRLGNREKRRQLQHEVAVLRMLQHECIVGFKGVWVDPPILGIVMEWCCMDLYDALCAERELITMKNAFSKYDEDESGTISTKQLATVMRALGRSEFQLQEILDEFGMLLLGNGGVNFRAMPGCKFANLHPLGVMRDIADGLAYLHAQGVVHRDMKSLNVLLTKDMRAKIADFGDAAMQAASESLRDSYHTENRHGTAAWMAPEAFLIDDRLTSAVDVFSFGIVAWECITFQSPLVHLRLPETGDRLFSVGMQGRDRDELTNKFVVQMKLRPPQPNGCDPALWALLERCWDPQAQNRPTFGQVIEDIDALNQERAFHFPYPLPAAERLRNPLSANTNIPQQ